MFDIGQSTSKSCPQCGYFNESTGHYLLDCPAYADIRVQLFLKLEGLLENKPNTYSKKSLIQILLCGEKPQLPNNFIHNKFIFLSVQSFICKTKRLFSRNWLHWSIVWCLLTCHNNHCTPQNAVPTKTYIFLCFVCVHIVPGCSFSHFS